MSELLLGSPVTDRSTGQMGCVTGFYILLPGTEANGNHITADRRTAGWFQETSYALARASPLGFVRVIPTLAGAPAYWRLSGLTAVEEAEA